MSAENVAQIRVREPGELGALVGKPGETLTETLRRTLLEMIVFGYFERGFRLYPERLAEQVAQHPFPQGYLSTIGDSIAGWLLTDADPQIVFHLFHLIFPTAFSAVHSLAGR